MANRSGIGRPDDDRPAVDEPPSVSPEVSMFARVAAVAFFVAFVAGVFLFARYGGPWVNSLDETVGEVVAARADRTADDGDVEGALALYAQALEQKFDNPQQFAWTSHRYAKLLIAQGRGAEAVPILERAIPYLPGDGTAYSMLNSALEESGQFEQVVKNAENWYAWAQKRKSVATLAWSKHHQGVALLKLGRSDDALAAFRQGFSDHPTVENALGAGRILMERGEREAARPYLQYIVEHDSDWMAAEAKSLLAQSGES